MTGTPNAPSGGRCIPVIKSGMTSVRAYKAQSSESQNLSVSVAKVSAR
jgi:hypothetical protein